MAGIGADGFSSHKRDAQVASEAVSVHPRDFSQAGQKTHQSLVVSPIPGALRRTQLI